MSIKISNKDVCWGYIGPIFNLGTNVILMPFILKFLSESMLGLWYVFSSIGNFVVLFDFGFSSTLARNIAYCYSGAENLEKTGVSYINPHKQANIRLLKEVIAVCKCVYFIISMTAIIIMGTVGTSYIQYITNGITEQYALAWLFYCVAVYFNLYYGYLTAYLKGLGAISEQHKATVISKMLQIVISLILLKNELGIVAVSIGYLVCGFSYRLSALYYTKHYDKIHQKMKQNTEKLNLLRMKEIFKTIWSNAWREGLISISNYMTSYATTLICSVFLTLAETGIYSLCLQVAHVLSKVSGALYSTFQPRLQELSLKNDTEKSKQIMSIAIIIFYMMYTAGMAVVLIIGVPVIQMIKPDIAINRFMLACIGIYTLLNQNQQLFCSYISNTNRLPYIKAYIFWGLASVVGSIFILYKFHLGAWGILLPQMICLCAYNMWKWPLEVMKNLGVTWIEFIGFGLLHIKFVLRRYKQRL